MQHRAAGHHVVHQLVRRDAEAVDGHALPADVGDVDAGQEARDLALGDRREHRDAGLQALGAHPLGQAIALVAAADHHEGDRGAGIAQPLGRVQQRVERIGQAHRAGVAHHRAPGGPRRRDRAGDILAQRLGRAVPLVERDAVGHDVQLAQVQAAPGHVLVHLRQHRHDHVGVAVGIVLGLLAHQDEGMARRHAAQLDRRQRPEVVHLEDQLRAGQPGQAARHPDVHRIGARGDHHVGAEMRGDARRRAPDLAQEGPDVLDPAQAVALVGRAGKPQVVDAVDVLVLGLLDRATAGRGRGGAHMRGRAGHHLHPVAQAHPFAREIVGTEFHAERGRAGIVVQVEKIHRAPGTAAHISSAMRSSRPTTAGANWPCSRTHS